MTLILLTKDMLSVSETSLREETAEHLYLIVVRFLNCLLTATKKKKKLLVYFLKIFKLLEFYRENYLSFQQHITKRYGQCCPSPRNSVFTERLTNSAFLQTWLWQIICEGNFLTGKSITCLRDLQIFIFQKGFFAYQNTGFH